ncbi:ribonuclease H-like domain-containing protein [Tanacetum coccineum]
MDTRVLHTWWLQSKFPCSKPVNDKDPITTAEEKVKERLEDAKKLLEAVEKIWWNAVTRKTLRNLLKQQYENFTAPSSEMLDQTFDRLQKNKAYLDTMSMDELYNNLKVYEPEVEGMSSSSSSTQNMAFVSSSNNNISSTNGAVNTAQAVNTAHGVSTANTQVNGHYALALVQAPRNQDNKNKESSRRSVPVETSTSTSLVSCDGLGGYDWSDQAGEGPNYALMTFSSSSPDSEGNPQMVLQDQGVIDSGCSRHMTGNMSYLTDYEEIDEGYVAFGGNPKGGKITRKGTIKTDNLDFENVYFVRELKFNLFSVSQMCDKKNSVLFNDTEYIVLSPNFKLIDESQILLRVPRKNNMYSVDLKNIVPKGGLTCLFAKATSDESKLWHRRIGHLNFKTMNKLVKGNLVRGLPSKLFENDQTCVACQKGKQHRALNPKTENVNKSPTLHSRTPQQNGVVERRNMTLIEAARTMLADSKLPTTFWAEAVNTACYVQNRIYTNKKDVKEFEGTWEEPKVYVDDIIFGSTKKELCIAFKKLMHEKFQMSSMGELTFFLGLQVKQKKDGIFISQDKYVAKILKKFGFTEVKTASTPMETQKPLLKDEDGEEVDVHMYRSMIGSLMYLTSSRPDIMFAVCACARYQVNPKVSHLYAVKRIFRYLKGQPKLGFWYPKYSPFDLVAYTDSDYAGASLDRKSTIGGKAKKSVRLMMGKKFGMELKLILVTQS